MSVGPIQFTLEELALNKQGKLSEKQRMLLVMTAQEMNSSSSLMIKITGVFILFGFILISFLFLQNERSRAPLFSDSSHVVLIAFVVIAIIMILALSRYITRNRAKTLLHGNVQAVEGKMRFDEQYNPGAEFRSYQLIVGKKKFSYTQKVHSFFTEGKRYCFYFVKSGAYESVLSFEKL